MPQHRNPQRLSNPPTQGRHPRTEAVMEAAVGVIIRLQAEELELAWVHLAENPEGVPPASLRHLTEEEWEALEVLLLVTMAEKEASQLQ